MKIQDLSLEKQNSLLAEIQARTKILYSDICVTGTSIYGCSRETENDRPENYIEEDFEMIICPSDIDVIVWSGAIEKHDFKLNKNFIWENRRVSVKFKPLSQKHEKFNYFKEIFILPQYSLISHEVFDLVESDLIAYFEKKKTTANRWLVGRNFEDLINEIEYTPT